MHKRVRAQQRQDGGYLAPVGGGPHIAIAADTEPNGRRVGQVGVGRERSSWQLAVFWTNGSVRQGMGG